MDKNIYRGKRKDNGEWVYGYYVKHDTVKIVISSDDPKTKHYIAKDGFCDWGLEPPIQLYEVIPETVGQCVGAVDKTKRPIYEGDIVKIRLIGGTYNGFEWPNVAVSFKTECFGVTFGKEFVPLCGFTPSIELEIIGNIHDNPELLEG